MSRELENIEALIEKSKGEDLCFTAKPNGSTYITVLSPAQMQRLREEVVLSILQVRNDKTAELEKLMGIWKPATVNPEFEAAVQSMIQNKTPVPKKNVPEALPDPVEEKLTDILQEEAKRIKDKPIDSDPSDSKYPAKKDTRKRLPESMTEEAVYEMLILKKMKPKEIAAHYELSSTQVSNYIFQHDIKNYGKRKKSVEAEKPVPLRAQNDKCDTEKCRVCGKDMQFTPKMSRNMWPYKYQRRNKGVIETVYCCTKAHFVDGKAKDA